MTTESEFPETPGQMFYVPADAPAVTGDRMQQAVQRAKRTGSHLWVAVAAFEVSDRSVATIATEPLLLDHESLLSIQVGCYVCEQGFAPRLRYRLCSGEPK